MHAEPQFPRTLPDDDPRLRPTAGIDTPERRALRREIVERHLAGSAAVEGRAPVLFLMGGGGASGKGHVKDRLVETGDIPAGGAVQLDPDEIKGNFPEYRELVAAGDSRAAAVVHEESSAVAKGILGAAMDGRRDIVYDVTLGNPDKGRALIDSAKAGRARPVHRRGLGPAVSFGPAVSLSRRRAPRRAPRRNGTRSGAPSAPGPPAPAPARRTRPAPSSSGCGSGSRSAGPPARARRPPG
jgi:hypothetical protein